MLRCGVNQDLFTVVDSVPDQGIVLCFFCPFRCGKGALGYPYSCLINTWLISNASYCCLVFWPGLFSNCLSLMP